MTIDWTQTLNNLGFPIFFGVFVMWMVSKYGKDFIQALILALIIGIFCVAIGAAKVAGRKAYKNRRISDIGGFALDTVENLIYF